MNLNTCGILYMCIFESSFFHDSGISLGQISQSLQNHEWKEAQSKNGYVEKIGSKCLSSVEYIVI